MTETRWWRYVSAVIKDIDQTQAAKIVGIDKSAFSRWKKGASAQPDFVVKFARGFHLDVIEALVESGLITESEAKMERAAGEISEADLRMLDNDALLRELRRRLGPG